MKHSRGITLWLSLLTAFAVFFTPFLHASKKKEPMKVRHTDFYGWKAITLSNREAEVVIVPEIGRVMRFSLTKKKNEDGPFWRNPALGNGLQADSEGWTNYGGDKAWPAPQSDWPQITGKGWPPPKGFDFSPFHATIKGDKVETTSAVDPDYGIRVQRVISLDPKKPEMTIKTTYEKVKGDPVKVGVWTITQLNPPERAFIRLPKNPAMAQGYTSFLPNLPKDLEIRGRLLSLIRDPDNKTLIGTEGDALLWVGDGPDLLIVDKTPQPKPGMAERPDKGSHAKIYTNSGDELKYVEFELLEPLHTLKRGESASMTTTYALIPRKKADPWQEAEKVLHGH
jgi:hypothetical protein